MTSGQESVPSYTETWGQALLRHCQRNARQAALAITQECRTKDDVEGLREFAIQTLQELQVAEQLPPTSLEQARTMIMPYSTTYNVEDDEAIFHVLESLMQPDVHHPENHACRSARVLWSPRRADRLLWAKQAWEHPEVDAQTRDAATELHHVDKNLLDTNSNKSSSNVISTTNRSLSRWIQKWCTPYEMKTEEWLLLLPSRHFPPQQDKANDLLRQIATTCWDWLLQTLRTALLEWRLDAMFPSLLHPIVHNHWKVQDDAVLIQSLVFIVRVYCTMRALQRDSMETPLLLTKVLRCATLLQIHASQIFQQVDLPILISNEPSHQSEVSATNAKSQATLDSTGTISMQQQQRNNVVEQTSKRKHHSIDAASVQNDSAAKATKKQKGLKPNVTTTSQDGSLQDKKASANRSKKDQATSQSYACKDKGAAISVTKTYCMDSTDPFAQELIERGVTRQQLLDHPVEKLDENTGRLLKTFPNAFSAYASFSRSQQIHFFYRTLLGQRVFPKTQEVIGHKYKGYFWRLKGSSAVPCSPVTETASSLEKADVNLPQNTKSTMDPVVAKLIYGGKSHNMILTNYPVEKLDPITGKVVCTFATGEAALASLTSVKHGSNFFYIVAGMVMDPLRDSMKRHMYKGFFWRFQGSTATPITAAEHRGGEIDEIVRGESSSHSRVKKKPDYTEAEIYSSEDEDESDSSAYDDATFLPVDSPETTSAAHSDDFL